MSRAGAYSLAAGLTGYQFRNIGVPVRITLIAGAVLLIIPEILTDIIGIALVGIPMIVQLIAKKREKRQMTQTNVKM